MLVGTPRYLSPEQVAGEPVGATTDLYALAVVLYELLTGSPPFSGETPAQIMMMHVQDIPQPVLQRNPDVTIPEALDSFIRVALEKDPRKRYQTAHEFRKALLGAVADVGAGGASSTRGPSSVDSPYNGIAVATANTEMDLAQQALGAGAGIDETTIAPGIPERTVTAPLESRAPVTPAPAVPPSLEIDTAEVVRVPTAPMQLDPTAGYDQVVSAVVSRGRRPWWPLLVGGIGLLALVPWATSFFGSGEVEQPVVEPPVHVRVAEPAGVALIPDVVSDVQQAVEAADSLAPSPVADSYLPLPDVVAGGLELTLPNDGSAVPLDVVTLESSPEVADAGVDLADLTGTAETVVARVAPKPRVKPKEREKSPKSGTSGSGAKRIVKEREKPGEPAPDDWFDDVEKLPTE
jgi:hypothetical protein